MGSGPAHIQAGAGSRGALRQPHGRPCCQPDHRAHAVSPSRGPGLPPYHHLPTHRLTLTRGDKVLRPLARLSAHWDRLSRLLSSGQGGVTQHTTSAGLEHSLHPETRAHAMPLPDTGAPPRPAPLQEALPRYCLLQNHDSSESKLSKTTRQSI